MHSILSHRSFDPRRRSCADHGEMITTATALIDWHELWRIVVAALIGGTGVVMLFGLLLLGISRGTTATRPAARYTLYALSALCGVLIAAVAAAGVYAMTQKPSSGKPSPKPAAARVAPARPAAMYRRATAPRQEPRLTVFARGSWLHPAIAAP